MARLVEEPLARGANADELDALVDAAARERPGAGHRRGAGRPGARRFRRLRRRPWPRSRTTDAGRRCARPRPGQRTRPSATARPSTTTCSTSAVAVRRDGRLPASRAWPCPLTGVESRSRALRRAVGLALLLAFLLTAVLSRALRRRWPDPSERSWTRRGISPRATCRARSGSPARDEMGELAQILNRSADDLQARLTEVARDRARSGRHPRRHGGRGAGGGPQGHGAAGQRALRRGLGLREPVGRHYLESIRQREVGALRRERAAARESAARSRCSSATCGASTPITAGPFPGTEGTPHGAVLTFHDITERRRVEQIRRDFVANASHELRTPLTSIRGFVEALEDGAVDEPATAHRFLGKIRTHADRMAALVDDLLELSRLESGERPPLRGASCPRRWWRTWWRPSRRLAQTAGHPARARRRPRRPWWSPTGPGAAHPREPGGERDQVHAGRGPGRALEPRGRRRGGASSR